MTKNLKPDSASANGAADKKSTIVEQLLTRKEGASLEELTTATAWQPHSCRAFLTGLRKKGWAIDRTKRDDATTIWTGLAPASSGSKQA